MILGILSQRCRPSLRVGVFGMSQEAEEAEEEALRREQQAATATHEAAEAKIHQAPDPESNRALGCSQMERPESGQLAARPKCAWSMPRRTERVSRWSRACWYTRNVKEQRAAAQEARNRVQSHAVADEEARREAELREA